MLEDLPSELDRGPLDPVRIFEALQRHGVEYLTIGGVAVNVHGHVRNTRDVDILIEWSAENMRCLAAAAPTRRCALGRWRLSFRALAFAPLVLTT